MAQIVSDRRVLFDFREVPTLGHHSVWEIITDRALELLEDASSCWPGGDHPFWTEIKVGDTGYMVVVHDLPAEPSPAEPRPPRDANIALMQRKVVVGQILDQLVHRGDLQMTSKQILATVEQFAPSIPLSIFRARDILTCPECIDGEVQLHAEDTTWSCDDCQKIGKWVVDRHGEVTLFGHSHGLDLPQCSRCGSFSIYPGPRGPVCPDCGSESILSYTAEGEDEEGEES